MDSMSSIPSDVQDNINPSGDMDILFSLEENPEHLINGYQMNLDLQNEMDVFLTSIMPNEKPKQNEDNRTFDHTSHILRENTQLKMLNKKLEVECIEKESLLANYESKLAQKMKAVLDAKLEMEIIIENFVTILKENDDLKAQVGQLLGLVHQYQHLGLLNRGAYEKYSYLETKMKRAQSTIKRLKCKLTQNSEKGSDQKESVKLKNHIQRIWKLIVLGVDKAGLTIKEKKKLTKEYEEWFPSGDIFLHIKRKKKNLTNILQDLPTNVLEVSATPDNFVEILNSINSQNTIEVTDLNSPIYSTSTLLSSDYKVSSSDDSQTKTIQPLRYIPYLRPKQLNVPSYPCSPDSLSCQNDANTYSTEFPALSLNQQTSLAKNVLNFESSFTQYLKDPSDLNCPTKLRLHEVQSSCDKIQGELEQIPTDMQDSLEQEQSATSNIEFSTTIQESLDQSPCTVVNTIPTTDMQDSLEQESAISNIKFSTMMLESLQQRSSISNTNLSTQLKDPLEQRLANGISNSPTEINNSLEEMLCTTVSNTALRSVFEGSTISLSDTIESFSEEKKEESNEILSITFNEANIPLEVKSSSKNSATEHDLAEDIAVSDKSRSPLLIVEDGIPIFNVPRCLSPLPITPPLDTKLKKREKKSLENNLKNNAAVPSCKVMKKIDFRFVSAPVRVRGRTLLNRGVFNKRKIETTTDGEKKEQTELEEDQTSEFKDQTLGIKPATLDDKSLTQSDYAVACKSKNIRIEHQEIIFPSKTKEVAQTDSASFFESVENSSFSKVPIVPSSEPKDKSFKSQVGDRFPDVHHKKLLMNEGQGDCQRIDSLVKEFFQGNKAKDLIPEQVDQGHEKLLGILPNVELAAKKSVEAQRTNDHQIEEYDVAYADIVAKIEDTKETIAEKKVELVEAKKVPKNKLNSVPNRTLCSESKRSNRKRFPSTRLKGYEVDFDAIVPKKKTSVKIKKRKSGQKEESDSG